jgi:hypothetical protein
MDETPKQKKSIYFKDGKFDFATYREINKDKIDARMTKYREVNKELINNKNIAYYHAHKEEINAKRRAKYHEAKNLLYDS